MSHRLVWMVALSWIGTLSLIAAKPPGLPDRQEPICEEYEQEEPVPLQDRHSSSDAEEAETIPEPTPECPYLQRQCTPTATKPTEEVELGTPLENLERLLLARKLCHLADKLARQGNQAGAAVYYREAVRIAPGSRYAMLAHEKLDHGLARQPVVDEGLYECEEPAETPDAESETSPMGWCPRMPGIDPGIVTALEHLDEE